MACARGFRPLAVLAATVLLAAAACGDDGEAADEQPAAEAGAGEEVAVDDGPTEDRPAGPAAELSSIEGGGGAPFLGAVAGGADLDAAGYVEEELAASGTATSYRALGELGADGRWQLAEDRAAEYRTRVVVRRPADPDDFSGTVVVEWLNVSGGLDANPDWAFAAPEILRRGHAWVGVSAQRIGVEGGEVAVGVPGAEGLAGQGLKGADPERYGSLSHPGDAFAFDVYTQVGRALRAGEGLGGLEPERLLAVGESQSAFALTTYLNGVHPLVEVYDGFLVHSRGAGALPLGEPGAASSVTAAVVAPPTTIRDDLDVPVLVLQTEGDLLGVLRSHAARQPDTDRLRLWEVAGAAHADRYLIGPLADAVDCGGPVNDGPHRYVARAALRALDTWVRTGEAPPEAPRIEVDESGGSPAFVRDADGIVVGGIRTPHVDVPVAALSGDPWPTDQTVCLLLGSTRPFTAEQVAARYPSRDAYLSAWEEAVDAAIESGFVLAEDRQELLADAQPDRIPG